MNTPISTNELRKYISERHGDRGSSDAQRKFEHTVSPAPSPAETRQERRTGSDLWPEPVPNPRQQGLRMMALLGRFALVVLSAGLVAFLVTFGQPLLQAVHPLLALDSPSLQESSATERLAINRATAIRTVGPSTPQVEIPADVAPSSMRPRPQAQQASLTAISNPIGASGNSIVRGVTDSAIRFGIAAPFSGPAKELGENMKRGIEAAFVAAQLPA
jgi:hypothetical protein